MRETTENTPEEYTDDSYSIPEVVVEHTNPISYAGEILTAEFVRRPYDRDRDPIGYGI